MIARVPSSPDADADAADARPSESVLVARAAFVATAFSYAVKFYARVVTLCRVGARGRNRGRLAGWLAGLVCCFILFGIDRVMISINEAIAPLQCVGGGGGGGSEAAFAFFPCPVRTPDPSSILKASKAVGG